MNYRKQIAARIKQAISQYEDRTDCRLTYAGISELCNGLLSASRLSNYANAIRTPGPEEAALLSRVLGCEAAWLMCLNTDSSDGEAAQGDAEKTVLAIFNAIDPAYKSEWLALGKRWSRTTRATQKK